MKIQPLKLIAIVILLSACAVPAARASDGNYSPQTQVVNAQVSANGNAMTIDNATRPVTDPKLLAGHDGQDVKAKIRPDEETRQVKVLKVLAGYPDFWADRPVLEDSALRK